ncbi:hypothetical protein F4861DRAFT_22588 [Xylaria intraflava]|nr:hypothetical protein F4861DRAFT_22588 [Xylaria intraflava]
MKDHFKRGALHVAADYGHNDLVASLLDAKADLNQHDHLGHTPFLTACINGRLETLQLLWERGSKDQIKEANNYSDGPLHLACTAGHLNTAEWLLSLGVTINQPGYHGRTPLLQACGNGHVEVIKMLLDRGVDMDSSQDHFHNSPILWSCFTGQPRSIQILAEYGVSVSSVDHNGNNCFHKVVQCTEKFSGKHKDMLDQLIGYGGDINRQNKPGLSPLYMACAQQKLELIEYLLAMGADVNLVTSYGTTALMAACVRPNTEIVDILLKRKPDMTIATRHGQAALMLACALNRLENVKALIKNGAEVTVCDKEGHTPLTTAIFCGNIEIALEVLATPAYFPERPVKRKAFTECSINASHAAEIEEILLKKLEEGRFKECEQLPNILHWAVSNGALKLARRCISDNPQILRWKRDGATWLHIAARYGQAQLLRPGTDARGAPIGNAAFHGIDVLARARGGVTALHVAVANGDAETARSLLQMLPGQLQKVGAITFRNKKDESPLTISINRRYKDLEKLFWDEIGELGRTDSGLMERDSARAEEILELLAQYEATGHETVLNKLLQSWFRREDHTHDSQDYTTLDWAVARSQVPVLWWLLSKGGYSSDNSIARALRLVPDNYPLTDVRYYAKELLLHPPPVIDTVTSTSTERITLAPVLVEANSLSLQMQGTIVDIYANGQTVNIPYKTASVHDIVYGKGPESLMKEAKGDLDQHDLNALKMTLAQHIPSQRKNIPGHRRRRPPTPVYRPVDSGSPILGESEYQRNPMASYEPLGRIYSNFGLRWIHLPVNELQLMRDLARRLSHESNRLELDHLLLMKHFNRSWTEVAAGGKRNYMKPQYVRTKIHRTGYPDSGLAGGQPPGEKLTCTALYMPYLSLGYYDSNAIHRPDGPDGSDGSQPEESINSHDMKKVVHEPLTLDQYYYPTITDTDKRDNDQVVSKFLRQENDTKKTILMVNNLWIWIIDERTIITATAEGPEPESDSNLLQTTRNNILYGGARSSFERMTTVDSVMELILGVAIGSFMEKFIPVGDSKEDPVGDSKKSPVGDSKKSLIGNSKKSPVGDSKKSLIGNSKKGPIEIFRESIRDVTNEETQLFENFLAGLHYEAKATGIFQGRQFRLNPPMGQAAQNRYHVISSETELLHKTRDIYDELQILKSVAEDQGDVWKQAFLFRGSNKALQHYHPCTPDDVKKDLDDMISEAEQTNRYINTLLDLRQAEYSRVQAADSARQSKSVLIFTTITIIFLG